MTIIPEETLVRLLRSCLELSRRVLEQIETREAQAPAPAELFDAYSELIRNLHAQKSHDTTLADQSWEWIWKVKPEITSIQMYGRLAWINYVLLDLL